MSRSIFLGLLALFLLCFFCVRCHAPEIEESVRSQVTARLAAEGFDPSTVTVSGRDVTLQGAVLDRDTGERIAALAAAVPGVRIVNNLLSTTAEAGTGSAAGVDSTAETGAGAPAAGAADALLLSTIGGRLGLRGPVPDERTRAALLFAVNIWETDAVTDGLTVDPSAAAIGWLDQAPAFFGVLHRRGRDRDLDLEMLGDELKVEGEVVSELSRERLLGALGSALPGVRLIDALTIREAQTAAEELQVNLDTLLRGKIVEFELNSDQLTPRGRAILDEVSTVLQGTQGTLEISGHTDSSGADDYNLDLSRRRAETVREYLISKSLSPQRLVAVGYGEARPIADNSTPEGQKKNRRTEFRAVKEN